MSEKLRLSPSTISQLPQDVTLPGYDRSTHGTGIVHIGIGAFHRAHQAVYTDDVIGMRGGDWRITAVSLRSPDVKNQLQPQSGLYTLVEKSELVTNHRIIGSIDKVLVAPQDPDAVVDALACESTIIVTITITEKGYCQSNAGGQLDVTNPDIISDLATVDAPKTMPGFISAACARRKQLGRAGLTILSCDNISGNGAVTRSVVLDFAARISAELSAWIRDNVSFCDTMVDRMVPATTDDDIQSTSLLLGVEDRAAVVCEPFSQWVIEDNFRAERPKWEDAGALLVNDVAPFETMKLRLLNGSHSALAYLGHLSGHRFVHEAICSPQLNDFVMRLMNDEISSTLDMPAGFDLEEYKITVRRRFSNPQVRYPTLQVASDGSKKMSQRLLTTADQLVQQGRDAPAIAFVVAGWFRYLEAVADDGTKYSIVDPIADKLERIAFENRDDEREQVRGLIDATRIFSDALSGNVQFVQSIEHWLKRMHRDDVPAALDAFLSQ